jgi:hypothetical protein
MISQTASKFLFCLSLLVASDVFAGGFDDAVNLAVQGKTPQALEILGRLEKTHSVSEDLIHLTRARIYFQTNKLDESIKEYNRVKETSVLWLSALDEKAQAYGRKGDYAKVTSTLQSAMAPMFVDRVSPEIYFTAALTDLKICDYSSVFKVTEQFKKNFSSRLTKLAAQRKSLNPSEKTNAVAAIKAINSVTNKLQVIEAEVIERITLAQKNDNRPEQGQIQSGTDVIRFKVTDDVWVDELDSYQSKVKECPTWNRKRASL